MKRYVLGALIMFGLSGVAARAEDAGEQINLVDRNTHSRTLDSTLLALTAASYASAAYDAHTTLSALDHCAGCFEANRLMRPFVGSRASAYAFTLGLTSVSTYATYSLKRKGVRWWWVPMVTTTALHFAAGLHNRNISK